MDGLLLVMTTEVMPMSLAWSRSALMAVTLPFLVMSVAVCAAPPTSTQDDGVSKGRTAPEGSGLGGTSGGGEDDDDNHTTTSSSSSGGPTTPAGGCVSDAAAFDTKKMQELLKYLASPALAGREPGTPGDMSARKYVEDRLKCLGVAPGGDSGTYFQAFTDSDGTKSANVVGMIPGSDPAVASQIVVVSAHLDHLGGTRLGANDNASGIVTVLSIAQALRQRATAPRRTVAFMVFNSEELGCDGSHHYVDNGLTSLPIGKVVYDVNFDMVGTYSQNGNHVVAHGTMTKTPATPILNALLAKTTGLKVDVGVPGLGEDDSDYYPFCAKGIPMVGFFTDDPTCYHKSCDTEDRIDYPHLAQIAKTGGDLVAGLADSTTDLAAARAALKVGDLGCPK